MIAFNQDVMKQEIQLIIQGPNKRIKMTMSMVKKYFHKEEEVRWFHRAAPKTRAG